MFHSIIIPHRGRERQLERCVRSIGESAEFLGRNEDDFEIVVAQAGPTGVEVDEEWTRWTKWTVIEEPMPTFNKCRCLNAGVAAARGDVVSFLDCDAIVGRRWLEGAELLEDPERLAVVAPTEAKRLLAEGWTLDQIAFNRICYRVKYLPQGEVDREWTGCGQEEWTRRPRGWESYTFPETNSQAGKEPAGQLVFGNSQSSVRRADIGGVMFDEGYVGHGLEDLDWIRRFWEATRRTYRAVILTDWEHGMYHQRHGYEPNWRTPGTTKANTERFKKTRRASR